MLKQLLHWVYCLPIEEAALLALAATGLFLWLHRRYHIRRWWTPVLIGLLVCWAGVAVIDTIASRSSGIESLSLIPLHTYYIVFNGGEKELIRSAFMNVLLFYPGGLIALSLRPRWRILPVLLVFTLMSVTIELCQYWFGLGFAETDDVMHNTLGALLGMAAFRQYEKHTIKTGDTP